MKSAAKAERGQALAEFALFSVLAVLMVFGLLAWIPAHRARTAATAAAYACAQAISQAADPAGAEQAGYAVAQQTLDGDWSGTLGAEYRVVVYPPPAPGQAGSCAVSYRPPLLFNGLLGLSTDWAEEWFVSRAETHKASW